eukprot:TRINITY_DN11420_c0_g1_i1.p2 TRINITY_DN11420_c0_g1~~TRINITY_DN11420_c0_g1_i1.p2  ORF type:complete len:487 (-),score=117.32 TRINITY_DN11420_c0_g1_i1:129-1589(-)
MFFEFCNMKLFLPTFFAFLVFSALVTCQPACVLTGNWTSLPVSSSLVHIEVFQNSNGSLVVHATPWGWQTAPGQVLPGGLVSVTFVGADSPSISRITPSAYPDYNTHEPAPNCTAMFNWCKFPYCPVPEPPVWPPWPPPAVACGLSRQPCPMPTWEPTWQLNASTCMQPANLTGYLDPAATARWGLISLDWANAHDLWVNFSDPTQASCEETLVEQARRIKAANPNTRVFVYRNMELALEWLASERRAMLNSSYAGFFLQYEHGTGHGNGTVYNEPIPEGSQYFWDFRNKLVWQYWIDVIAGGPLATDNPWVDGIFTDDFSGIPAEHPNAPSNMGLSAQEVIDIATATQNAWTAVTNSLVAKQKYNWQMFGGYDGTGPTITQSNCQALMTQLCQPSTQQVPLMMGVNQAAVDQSVAAFLVVRGPYAYIGYGWIGQNVFPPWFDQFDLDVGKPLELCTQTSSGVFSRSWSNGLAAIDCNSWTATLKF